MHGAAGKKLWIAQQMTLGEDAGHHHGWSLAPTALEHLQNGHAGCMGNMEAELEVLSNWIGMSHEDPWHSWLPRSCCFLVRQDSLHI